MSIRSELKQNVLASQVEVVLNWIMMNKIPVATTVVVVVGGLLMGSVYMIRQQERRDLNWTRLAQAQSLLAEKRIDVAEPLLKEISTTSPGTPADYFATYYLGVTALDQKKFDEAIKHYSDLVSRMGQNPLRPLALANLGVAYDEKGDAAQAAQTYQRFMDQHADHFLAARTQLKLGESLLRSGDTEAAKKSLGHLIDLYPTSPWAQSARRILDGISKKS